MWLRCIEAVFQYQKDRLKAMFKVSGAFGMAVFQYQKDRLKAFVASPQRFVEFGFNTKRTD